MSRTFAYAAKGRPSRRSLLLAFAAALVLLSLSTGVPSVFAGGATAYTYSVPCTTTLSSFNQGATVYGGASGVTPGVSSVDALYINPSSGVAWTNSNIAVSSGSVCDSTGYALPSNAPTGTWTMELCKPGTSCANNGDTVASVTFTVNAAAPDLPFGAVGLLLPFLVIYFFARRRNGFDKSQ